MLTREELAKAVLEVLTKQREYFDKGRSSAALKECKALERTLKHECERIIEGPTLFDGD